MAFLVAGFQALGTVLCLSSGALSLANAIARRSAQAQLLTILIAFGVLTLLHAISDFSVLNVVQNSHSAKPFIYKLTGVWGNHEGSMLLWTLILAGFGAAFSITTPKSVEHQSTKILALAIQGATASLFLAFLIFTSNPFARLSPAPTDGQDLNPLLQDPGLIIHPPFLYLGYVGFSIVFALAIAGLIRGRIDGVWAAMVRPWALCAWSFLTIGIGLGSWWAYYELGWGGFWAWDPVENASFMPWLAGTALIHSLRVTEVRGAFKAWSVLLAILVFSLSLVGTFLVRSGIITSVHAFAVDPTRGVFILAILGAAIGGSLLLYGLRAGSIIEEGKFAPVSRESGLLVNNVLLAASCATVFLGTFYPLLVEIVTGDKLSVGAPYFNAVFTPFVMAALFVIGPCSALAWKKGNLSDIMRRIWPGLIVAAAVIFIAGWMTLPGPISAIAAAGVATWAGVAVLIDAARRAKLNRHGRFRRVLALPRSYTGMVLGHLGFVIVTFGAIGAGAWQSEELDYVNVGESITVANRVISLNDVKRIEGPNYIADAGTFVVNNSGKELIAERRFYPVRGMQTTEAGIRTSALGDTYITLGKFVEDKGWVVHVWRHPLTLWIWIGAGVIALAGLVSLSGFIKPNLDPSARTTATRLEQSS